MKLLLHICCAPCLIYPLERLKQNGCELAGVFYNPNLDSIEEYEKRKQALEFFNYSAQLNINYPVYSPSEFFQATKLKENSPERCSICWSLRLRWTALSAKKNGFDAFSTTLLVSPYQGHEKLKQIGARISEEEKIKFYYEDFRAGFRQAQAQAKLLGLYRQKYCGCVYSKKTVSFPLAESRGAASDSRSHNL